MTSRTFVAFDAFTADQAISIWINFDRSLRFLGNRPAFALAGHTICVVGHKVEPLPERGDAGLCFWVALGKAPQHTDAPYPVRLLRAPSGQVAAAPPSSVMNWRRLMSDLAFLPSRNDQCKSTDPSVGLPHG
jgi:hypothetical protein